MGLPWIRLDTAMPDNPKLLGLLTEKDGHRAAFVWISCLAYSGKHETAGFIPREAAPFCHGRTSDFRLLTTHRMLTENAGGWDIDGWSEFQKATETATERREHARKAAAARWSKKEASNAK